MLLIATARRSVATALRVVHSAVLFVTAALRTGHARGPIFLFDRLVPECRAGLLPATRLTSDRAPEEGRVRPDVSAKGAVPPAAVSKPACRRVQYGKRKLRSASDKLIRLETVGLRAGALAKCAEGLVNRPAARKSVYCDVGNCCGGAICSGGCDSR